MANWQAFGDAWNQGSFVSQVPAPDADPGAAPTICVQFGAPWLPYVLGALYQLTQPSAWDPTSAGFADVLTQAQDLMAIFSSAEVCTDMLQFQFTDTCGLQYSVDGGVTWIDVPGWDTFASTCFTGATGATGATGPTGPPFVGAGGAPPNPQGVSTDQQACNIAAYLAATIVKGSLQSFVNSKNAALTQVEAMSAIVALLSGFDPVVDLIVAAASIGANYVYAQTTSDYTDALASAPFQSDVQCAIYDAIVTDGYVTSGNFSTILANLAAISYVHSDVVTTVHDYVQGLGLVGLQMMQVSGSLYVGDCSACSRNSNALQLTHLDPDFVQMASDLAIGGGDFTIGGWIQSPAGGGYPQGLFCSAQAAPFPSVCGQISLGCYNVYNVGANAQNTGCSGGFCAGSMSSINNGGNHHIVMTRSGGTLKVYGDGNLLQTNATSASGSLSSGSGNTSIIGGANNNFGSGVEPNYAECTVWGWAAYVGTALSATDIANWYAAGSFGNPVGSPTNFWPFGEGSGTSVADTVGGNTGTIYGTPRWVTHS